MATYTVSAKQLTDNYAVLQTLQPAEFVVGQQITVAGVGVPFNGTFTILALPQFLFVGANPSTGFLQYNNLAPAQNQVLFACTGTNVNRVQSFAGTITYTQTCTWITKQDVLDWLGIPLATANDDAFVTACANAANQFAYRRRQESNYTDSLTTVPSTDVKLGTIMVAGAYYRSRGSMDSFASFNDMSSAPIPGISPMIKQLLGIERPAVA